MAKRLQEEYPVIRRVECDPALMECPGRPLYRSNFFLYINMPGKPITQARMERILRLYNCRYKTAFCPGYFGYRQKFAPGEMPKEVNAMAKGRLGWKKLKPSDCAVCAGRTMCH